MIRRVGVAAVATVVALGGSVWGAGGTSAAISAAVAPFNARGEVSCQAAGKVKFSPGLRTAARSVTTAFKARLLCSKGSTGRAGVTVVAATLRGTGSASGLGCRTGTISGATATVKWKAPGGRVNGTSIAWSDGTFTLGRTAALDFPGSGSPTVTGSYAGGGASLHLQSAVGPGASCASKNGWRAFAFAGGTATFGAPVDFYQPPNPLPPGNPGDVIRSQPSALYVGTARAAASVWTILYRSTSATGTAVAMSGTVIVPNAPYSGVRPILVYTPPTVGNGDQCATSKSLAAGTAADGFAYTQALAHGWAIAVPDYEGLGTPGRHTYLVGQSQGHAALDVARAAMRLTAAGLSSTAPVAVWGYSQGGQSAGWAAELQPTYAPELQLKGVAAGGVPVNIVAAIATAHDGGQYFGFIPSLLIGYDAAYPELNLDSFLTPAGRTVFNLVATQCYQQYQPALAFQTLAGLTTSNPFDNPAWQARLAENVLGTIQPAVPIHLFHGENDEIVPFAQATALNTLACQAGVVMDFEPLAGQNHFSAFPTGLGNTLAWIADRFAGLPAPNTCPNPGP
jgi:hypothetical protein